MLFDTISRGDVIRTTPVQSPRSNKFLPDQKHGSSEGRQSLLQGVPSRKAIKFDQPQDDEKPDDRISLPDDQPLANPSETSSTAHEQAKRRDFVRPPPILKKSRTVSSTQQTKTARILTPTWKTQHDDQDDNDETSPTTSASSGSEEDYVEGSQLQMAHVIRLEEDSHYGEEIVPEAHSSKSASRGSVSATAISSTKAGKKKVPFIASTISAKRRPTIVRRKSSQSSSGNTSKAPSPRLASQIKPAGTMPSIPRLPSSSRRSSSPLRPPSDAGRSKPSNSPLMKRDSSSQSIKPSSARSGRKSQSARTSRSASPASYRPFHQPSLGGLALGGNSEIIEPPFQDWLVDRDFRSKFVSRIQPSILATGPSSHSKSVGHSKSERADKVGVNKGKGTMVDDERYVGREGTLKVPGAASSAIEDDEELPAIALPRTKSQISLMIEDERRRNSGRASGTGKGKGKKR